MGLTLFTYLAVILATAAILSVKSRGASATVFRIAAITSILYALFQVTGYLLASDYQDIAVVLLRCSGPGAIMAYLAFLRLAMAYPYTKRMLVVDIVLSLIAAASIWLFVFTEAYIVSVKRFGIEYIRFEGDYHHILDYAFSVIGLLAVITMLLRAIAIRSRVYRQHLVVMALGLLASVAWGYVFGIVALDIGFKNMYPLSTASILFSVLSAAYAFSSTRVFQLRAAIKGTMAWLALILLFGVPLGLIVGIAFLFRDSAWGTSIGLAGIAFVVIGRWAESFARRHLGSGHDDASREELEAAIAHLDLSEGREKVLSELSTILIEAFGCSWLSVLSEDDTGGLRRIFPDDNDELVSALGSPALEALSSLDRRVVFKTDVISDDSFSDMKPVLLAFFDALGAEAMVLAKEGRRVVGAFVFGPKKSGADYDAQDYASFDAVHGKLFVVAYYARHVAREALLETVEQEIGLADQIVRSIQEKIDPIVHPGVNVAFRCESPRGLGGDLFDSVRISEHRWFFVVGDISGKGLNASMSMVILKSMIRTLLKEEKDFVKLVSRVNTFIKERLPRGTFFSGMFCFLALDKGSIYFMNCGIPAMFFRSPGLDAVVEAQGEGKMLGFVKNIEPFLKTRKLMLPPGSRLFISTDGIVEAESVRGERYGKERLVRILTENKNADVTETVDAVITSASAFAGGRLDDDITVVAIDYDGYVKEKKR